ncbi:hypothetical protein OIE69_44350 (plasmid) [Actinacidiphila glaucinigra]|uniref:hypothetical protein n=1 Tax=Actinacidiphila glaucinigra TaxID=235986 RepID=UPI002DD87B32|nr:hypothetical protein [Actinacidiphila glaucinigra]WSD65937.1 hypothetical protein OIE69_44350 [Actinacidiphila glaucinigra]
MSEPATSPDSVPLLIGAQVQAFALEVRRQTCTDLATLLCSVGHPIAAGLVDVDRDFTELSRSLAAMPTTPAAEHKAHCRAFDCRCGCARAQDCQDCGRCVCWRAECCAQVPVDRARQANRTAALRRLLDSVDLQTLSELRGTAAEAEEASLRRTIARRIRLLVPADGRRYTHADIEASDSKLCMGHADYSTHGVELYDEEHATAHTVDLNDAVVSAALGTLAELLRPDDGALLTIDLTTEELPG